MAIAVAIHFEMASGYHKTVPILNLTVVALAIAFAFSWKTMSEGLLGKNDISYGVYIYHMLVINLLVELGYSQGPFALVVTLIATTFLAMLSWFLIESPCLRFKK